VKHGNVHQLFCQHWVVCCSVPFARGVGRIADVCGIVDLEDVYRVAGGIDLLKILFDRWCGLSPEPARSSCS